MVDLLVVFAFIAAGSALICFAAGMIGDCIAFAILWALLVAAAVALSARRERTRR